MLSLCVLYHIEVKCTSFDAMAELEDFELILCRLILLFRDLCVTVIVLNVRLWSTHHHRILGLIATHEGLIVLKSRLLHIVH